MMFREYLTSSNDIIVKVMGVTMIVSRQNGKL
jgi:hypothetical protein